MKGVQCYELFGGIALKIHTFSFFFHFQIQSHSSNTRFISYLKPLANRLAYGKVILGDPSFSFAFSYVLKIISNDVSGAQLWPSV